MWKLFVDCVCLLDVHPLTESRQIFFGDGLWRFCLFGGRHFIWIQIVSDREETGRECSMTPNKGHLQELDWSRLRLSGRAAFCTVSEEDNTITICNKCSRDQRREKGALLAFLFLPLLQCFI